MRVLRLVEIQRARSSITAACAIEDLRFEFTVWYEDVDLGALDRDLADRLAFHVAMFQINAVCSLKPDAIELGPYARFATRAFQELSLTIFRRVWAQWRICNLNIDIYFRAQRLYL